MSIIQTIQKSVRSSLRTKFILPMTGMIALAGAVLFYRFHTRVNILVLDQARAAGSSAAAQLAASLEAALMTGDPAQASTLIQEQASKAHIAWAYILDENGELVAHSFKNKFPEILLNKNKNDNWIKANQHEALEISQPLMEGSLGTLVIGMDKSFVSAPAANLQRDLLITVGIVFVLTFGILWFLLELIIQPIRTLTIAVQKIIEEGDLSQEIQVLSKDETGKLASYFNAMVQNLRQIPLDLSELASTLGAAVEQLEGSIDEQNQVVTRQAAALQETQVTAEEIKQTSKVAARSADSVLEESKKAGALGQTGERAVEKSMDAMNGIRDQVGTIAEQINGLEERTRQIGTITDTVKELADQSNILALNASIEAVRSGEHGKGFGLVAREIRRLADQSIQSTAKVREILETITVAARDAVSSTDKGLQRMEVGMTQIRSSGDNLKSLASLVQDNANSVRQIASAVGQQDTGISQIFTAVVDQNKMMDESLKRLEASQQASASLKQVSLSLLSVVDRYKV